jgi:hypothetical protein
MPRNDDGKRIAPRTHLNAATSKYVPLAAEEKGKVAERKARFETINEEIRKAGGWITSIPGNRIIDFECLPGNPLPDRIRESGFNVHEDGEGERILPTSVVERFVRAGDGSFELATEETAPDKLSHRVTHAGIARVERFWFDMDHRTAK